nr:reverse transcriptase domain-containing protein [Tanacetum cinerariifolium]
MARETEVTKDKVQTTNQESTAYVQPPVIQVPIQGPEVAPKPKPKPSIPYQSRLDDQKLQEKDNNQMLNIPLNENCSAVLLKKLPEKLGDPDKFLIPCDFSELEECLALADLSASINLMPLFLWKAFAPGTYSCSHDSRASKPIGRLSGSKELILLDVAVSAADVFVNTAKELVTHKVSQKVMEGR